MAGIHRSATPCGAGFGGPGRFTLGGVGSWEMARRLQRGLGWGRGGKPACCPSCGWAGPGLCPALMRERHFGVQGARWRPRPSPEEKCHGKKAFAPAVGRSEREALARAVGAGAHVLPRRVRVGVPVLRGGARGWLFLDRMGSCSTCVSPRVGAQLPRGPRALGTRAPLPRRAPQQRVLCLPHRPGRVHAASCSGLRASVDGGRGRGSGASSHLRLVGFQIPNPSAWRRRGRSRWPLSALERAQGQVPAAAPAATQPPLSLRGLRPVLRAVPRGRRAAAWLSRLPKRRPSQLPVPAGQGRDLIRQAPRAGR